MHSSDSFEDVTALSSASAQWCIKMLLLWPRILYTTGAGKGVKVAMETFHSSGRGVMYGTFSERGQLSQTIPQIHVERMLHE